MGLSELLAAVRSGAVGQTDYVYREGFQDWKKLLDVSELAHALSSGSGGAEGGRPTRKDVAMSKRDRRRTDRAPIDERVIAHNDFKIASGALTDISVSGVLFETSTPCFSINDEVKLTLKEGRGLGKPLNLRGTIVRQTKTTNQRVGYGIELMNLDIQTRAFILGYINKSKAS